MTGGIGYEIDQLAELGVPELMRRQQVDPQLKYALALQEATKMVEAAARERDMSQPMPAPANVVGQMETNLAKRLAPGVQQQGRRSMQMRNRAAMGLPGQPAPNMARMAMGGIVGYQEGGDVMVGPPEPNMLQRMGQGLKNMGGNMAESSGILREAKAGIGVPYEKRAAIMQQVRDEVTAESQNRDPNFVERMGQKLMDMGLNVEESKAILKKVYDDMGKTYEEKAKGMAMGGVVNYASGGEVKAYLASIGQDVSDFTEAQIEALGQMLDSQVARGQNDTLRQVGRGAMGLLKDRMPATTSMSQAGIDAREADIEQRRGGLGALLTSDESGPSVTEQLEAAERRISAEGRGQSTGRNVSPGRAAAMRRRELRDQMPDQEASPSMYERTKDYMPDFGALIGGTSQNIEDFLEESGLSDVDYGELADAFASSVLPQATQVAMESDDPSLGRYLGAIGKDLASGPGRLADAILGEDFIADLQEGYAGTESAPAAAPTATPTPAPAPLTEAEKFRRDAPAGLVSAIDANTSARDRRLLTDPSYAQTTAQERTAERAAEARRNAPPTSGLAGLLSRIDMGKVVDVAEVLGRGAGASKGFEAAKIVEESAKARAIQEARQDQLDKLRQQLEVEREKIAATQTAAEAAATARLNQEQMRQLSDFLTSDAYTTAQLQKAKELGVDISDPRVTQALEPMVRDFIDKVRGGVSGMGGLDTQSGLSAEQRDSLTAFLAS